jgi:hypothetical protein
MTAYPMIEGRPMKLNSKVLIAGLPECGLFGDDDGADVAPAHEQFFPG